MKGQKHNVVSVLPTVPERAIAADRASCGGGSLVIVPQPPNERCSWQALFGCDFRRNGDSVLAELGR